MTKPLYGLAGAILVVFTCGALAETATSPAPMPARQAVPADDLPLDTNYALTLTSADKKGPDILVLVASQRFTVSNTQPRIDFRGRLIAQENGTFLLYYSLEQNGASTQSTVLLKTGEPIQIVKNGDQFYNLKLDRYNAVVGSNSR